MTLRPVQVRSLACSLRPGAVLASTWCCVLLLVSAQSPAHGQEMEPRSESIRWWHGAVVAGGAAILFFVDEPVQQAAQRARSTTLDNAATGFRQMGEPLVVYSASLGTLGVGVLRDDAALERSGARMTASVSLAAVLVHVGKLAFGRDRPNVSGQAFNFNPFSGVFDKSFPSGHTALAFALATTLADDVENTVATVGLFALATGTGWSRMNDNKHWTSDVALGAVVGMASAKLVNGRWTILGLETPSYLKGRRSDRSRFGEVMVGMGAGVGLYYVTSRIVKGLRLEAPVVAPSRDGGVMVGWQWQF